MLLLFGGAGATALAQEGNDSHQSRVVPLGIMVAAYNNGASAEEIQEIFYQEWEKRMGKPYAGTYYFIAPGLQLPEGFTIVSSGIPSEQPSAPVPEAPYGSVSHTIFVNQACTGINNSFDSSKATRFTMSMFWGGGGYEIVQGSCGGWGSFCAGDQYKPIVAYYTTGAVSVTDDNGTTPTLYYHDAWCGLR